MRLLNCSLDNFASYTHLDIDFTNQGLALIYGKTGSGKSTIMDAPTWCIFGITAKNGSVDDIKSWKAAGELTKGVLNVESNGSSICITRVRGRPGQNDLFWTEDGNTEIQKRGKDLNETQKLLEHRLGVSADTYLTGAYFQEFSETNNFFTAKAKDRRALFERIAPLQFAKSLESCVSDTRREVKQTCGDRIRDVDTLKHRLEQLRSSETNCRNRLNQWEKSQKEAINDLSRRYETFEKEKEEKIKVVEAKLLAFETEKARKTDELMEKIERLQAEIKPVSYFGDEIEELGDAIWALSREKCPTCAGPLHSEDKDLLVDKRNEIIALKMENSQKALMLDAYTSSLEDLATATNLYQEALEITKSAENTYDSQLARKKAETNPYYTELKELTVDIENTTTSLTATQENLRVLEHELTSLNYLYDISSDLRGQLLARSVQGIEDQTNQYLEKYFDGEIRVSFVLEGSDSLQANLQKNGFKCNFKQLSKGQRQLLRLCFSISVMKAAANKAGVHFDQLWFDEALEGLDSDLKVKAFHLFEELGTQHESVMVIDHAQEFQQLFTKRYHVSLMGDESSIWEENE